MGNRNNGDKPAEENHPHGGEGDLAVVGQHSAVMQSSESLMDHREPGGASLRVRSSRASAISTSSRASSLVTGSFRSWISLPGLRAVRPCFAANASWTTYTSSAHERFEERQRAGSALRPCRLSHRVTLYRCAVRSDLLDLDRINGDFGEPNGAIQPCPVGGITQVETEFCARKIRSIPGMQAAHNAYAAWTHNAAEFRKRRGGVGVSDSNIPIYESPPGRHVNSPTVPAKCSASHGGCDLVARRLSVALRSRHKSRIDDCARCS
jgi:hypothetical protein